jgi:1-acyl-sn-glycerol-3-phosphate acyltransferase
MVARLSSIAFWTFLVMSSALLFPVALVIWAVTLPFDRRKRLLHLFTSCWGCLYVWTNPLWPVVVEHRDRLCTDRPCVLVANHASLLDILVLFRLFTHFKWVSKIENFRVPFIGWNMYLNSYIPLQRGDKQSVIRMLRLCQETLRGGSSIMMFPEGTRSTTGRMRAFKPGAFELAIKAGVPIQPIVLAGTADALPKRGFVLQGRHPISITVLDSLPPESFAGSSMEALAQKVRGLIADQLGEEVSADAAEAPLPSTAS